MGWCNYIYQFSYSNKQLDKRQNNITLIDYYSSNCHIYNYETIGYYIYLFFSHFLFLGFNTLRQFDLESHLDIISASWNFKAI